ncbi:hybrid sensor histidine kinase/response regulator [Chondromyces apiculatus]|uniref:histidine kinase n=1 Tax=Chondromyces apiculatus DSM 436 TaxID=1192034 RepID=A0A017T0Y2_9BACT|nr:ATP-binding protein [Chondromyces apiculatus]EYF02505.1 Hypothetical protein CAP_7127 [Chondromyces apiculatus DSM 436]
MIVPLDPGSSPTRRLAAFLHAERDVLLAAWTQRVVDAAGAPEAKGQGGPALGGRIGGLLDQLRGALEGCPEDEEEAARRGRQIARVSNVERGDVERGERVGAGGEGLAAALREIGHLRAILCGGCARGGIPLEGGGGALVHAALDELAVVLGEQAGSALAAAEGEGVRLSEEVKATRDRFALLAKVSVVMGDSLDYESRLQALSRLIVPAFADASAVSILDEEGRIQRLTDAATDGQGAAVRRARRMPVPVGLLPIIEDTLRTGRVRYFADYDREVLAGLPADDPYVVATREVGVKAILFAPLCVRDRQLGYLTAAMSTSGRDYSPEDVVFLEAIAERAALAIDNARLFREAERQRLRLAQVFEQAPVAIAMLRGPDHVYELANPLVASPFQGLDLIGKTVGQIVQGSAVQGVVEDLDQVYRTGEPLSRTEIHLDLPVRDGSTRATVYADLVCQPMRNEAGEIDGIIAVFIDVTERVLARSRSEALAEEHLREQQQHEAERNLLLARAEQARAAAEEASELKDQFLATVSHELRTPLNAILGWTRILRTTRLPAERQERALETVERNARAQTQLIEDLLDISRVVSGKLRLEASPLDLGTVVEAVLETVRPAAEAKQITLTPSLGSGATVILGDPARLQQVIWNLLSNAIKFTAQRGHVEVRIGRDEAFAAVEVKDDGRGISPEFLPHVFERFRQAEGSTTRAHGGLGLGLAIVKSLVELHGGTIQALSEGEGQGSTFVVRLPFVKARQAEAEALAGLPASAAPDVERPPALHGKSVVVVDDEADAREVLVEILERCGARVVAAGSAAEAFAAVERTRPDLLVADIAMPGEDGYMLIRKVRALPPEDGGLTLAVALTAYTRREDEARALRAGFDMHVPKPVDPIAFLDVLESLLRRGHAVEG